MTATRSKPVKLAMIALAAALVTVASASALAAPPASHPHAAGRAAPSDNPSPQGAPAGGNASHERGHGLLTAMEHVPAQVKAHLRALWDAMLQGLRGLGSVARDSPAAKAR